MVPTLPQSSLGTEAVGPVHILYLSAVVLVLFTAGLIREFFVVVM